MSDKTHTTDRDLVDQNTNNLANDNSQDTLVQELKTNVVQSAVDTVLKDDNVPVEVKEKLKERLLDSLGGEGPTEFARKFIEDTYKIIESLKGGQLNFFGFITHAIKDIEPTDNDYVTDIAAKIVDLTDEDPILHAAVDTGSTEEQSNEWHKEHVGRHVQIIKEDSTAVLLWLTKVSALVMTSDGEKDAAAVLTIGRDGKYTAVYLQADIDKVVKYINATLTEEFATFQIVNNQGPTNTVEADTLTAEEFGRLVSRDSDTYNRVIEKGGSEFEALYASGVEAWALENDVDLDDTGITVTHQKEIIEYIENEFNISLPDQNEAEIVHTEDAGDSNELDPQPIDDAFVEDAEIVEEEDTDPFTIAETDENDSVSADTDTFIGTLNKVIDNLNKDDERLLSIAADLETSPKQNYITTVLNQTKALHGKLTPSQENTLRDIATSAFRKHLPTMDKLLEKHREYVNSLVLVPDSKRIENAVKDNAVHSAGISKLSDEARKTLFDEMVSLKRLTGHSKDEADLFDAQVIEILNIIAPFDYSVTALTDPMRRVQLENEIDDDGKPFRVRYVANMLRTAYTQVPSKQTQFDYQELIKLSSKGPTGSLFSTPSDKVAELVKKLPEPKTYTVCKDFIVMCVTKSEQEIEEDGHSKHMYMYSIMSTSHANNIVVVAHTTDEGVTTYTIISSTTYNGITDVSKYVKDVLI